MTTNFYFYFFHKIFIIFAICKFTLRRTSSHLVGSRRLGLVWLSNFYCTRTSTAPHTSSHAPSPHTNPSLFGVDWIRVPARKFAGVLRSPPGARRQPFLHLGRVLRGQVHPQHRLRGDKQTALSTRIFGFLATLRLIFARPYTTAAAQAPPNDAPTFSTPRLRPNHPSKY